MKKPTIIVPMAGNGSRFKSVGYPQPKPMIPFLGKTMIEHVLAEFTFDARYIFIVQQAHIDEFQIDQLVTSIIPDAKVISVNGVTDGAARSVLLAQKYIDNKFPLIVINSDNIIRWNNEKFNEILKDANIDGAIFTFSPNDDSSKWSFVTTKDGLITKVAEKERISDTATAGLYFWSTGESFVRAASEMINLDIRTNNEFYLAPVFNQNIGYGQRIVPFEVDEMWGVGTPEDLQIYIEAHT